MNYCQDTKRSGMTKILHMLAVAAAIAMLSLCGIITANAAETYEYRYDPDNQSTGTGGTLQNETFLPAGTIIRYTGTGVYGCTLYISGTNVGHSSGAWEEYILQKDYYIEIDAWRLCLYDYTIIDEVAPTCEVPGCKAYVACSNGKAFVGSTLIAANADALAAWKMGDGKIAAKGHTLTKTDEVGATCTKDGHKAYWTCSVCGKSYADETGITLIDVVDAWTIGDGKIAAKGHTLKKTGEAAASCTADGHKAYWTCSVCGKSYADEEGKTLISDLSAWLSKDGKIKAKGHTLKKTDAVAASATADGHKAYWTCSVCGKSFEDEAGTIAISNLNAWLSGAGKLPAEKPAEKIDATNFLKKFKVTQQSKKLNIEWGKQKGADGYAVYAQYCGSKPSKKVKEIKSAGVTKVSITKLNKKAIDRKKVIKVYVEAYKIVNGKKQVIAQTSIAHAAGTESKYTDPAAIRVSKTALSLKVGKSATIKASVTKKNANKKQLKDSHVKALRYRSMDESVAVVNAKGKITAKGKGTCNILVIGTNGLASVVKVTVK